MFVLYCFRRCSSYPFYGFANCNIVDLTDTLHLMPADAKLHEGQMQRVWRGHRFAPFTDWVRPVPYLGAPLCTINADTYFSFLRYPACYGTILSFSAWHTLRYPVIRTSLPPNGGTGAKREECLVVPSLWQCSALFEAGAGQSRAIKGPAADLTDPASKPTTIDALPWHPLAHQRSYDHHLCSLLPFLALRAN